MGMTRRDYVLIADTMREQIDRRRNFRMADCKTDPNASGYSALCLAVWQLADRLAENNPRFDKQRFISACGLAT
jgi:hypothetical protein